MLSPRQNYNFSITRTRLSDHGPDSVWLSQAPRAEIRHHLLEVPEAMFEVQCMSSLRRVEVGWKMLFSCLLDELLQEQTPSTAALMLGVSKQE